MRRLTTALLASAHLAFASQTVFSVHDDLLAFPQYEVIISESFVSERDADLIIGHVSSTKHDAQSSTKSLESQLDHADTLDFDPAHETYELMKLNNQRYLCTIPIVDTPARNETSEAEARAAEQKELARATDRGWELLQDLEGNCLFFISGWWSYSFCYNAEITQFHQLPAAPGKPPQKDPNTMHFVLGRAKATLSKEDEWGNEIDVRKGQKNGESPRTELQVKGDTRYLVQRMEGGTTCDLTGKPRRVEVQFHCNPHVADRIGYIKEVTTCSYLMVVYTARLCNDVAFLPPKDNMANEIVCRAIVPQDEIASRTKMQAVSNDAEAGKADAPINIGGVIVGGGRWASKEGQRMPLPKNLGPNGFERTVEVIAKAQSKAKGGQVEVVSDADLAKLDLDPKMVEKLKKEVQALAKEQGWQLEVIDEPGQEREIMGVVVDEDEEKEGEEGSQEIFKDEL